MELNWQSNSKLNALIILLDNGVSSNDLIKLNPNCANEMIDAVSERSTACLVADLYSRLFKGHRDEIVKNKDLNVSLDQWSIIWWSPILNGLASMEKSKKTYIYEVEFCIFMAISFFWRKISLFREKIHFVGLYLKYGIPSLRNRNIRLEKNFFFSMFKRWEIKIFFPKFLSNVSVCILDRPYLNGIPLPKIRKFD